MRGRRNLELALNNLLGRRLETCVVEKEDFAVEDVEQSVNGKQSVACQSENASDLAFALPSCTSDTQSISNPSLGSSNVLNSQPGILCQGVKNNISK